MSLALHCAELFSTAVTARGSRYFRGDRVEITAISTTHVEASVYGSEDNVYDTHIERVDLDGELTLLLSCSCPHADRGEACKHMWALLLAANDTPLARGVEQVGSVRARLEAAVPDALLDAIYGDDDDDDDDGVWCASCGEYHGAPASFTWQQALQGLSFELATQSPDAAFNGALEYELDVEASRHRPLVVRFVERRRRKDGTLGKPRAARLSLADAGGLADADRAVVEALLTVGERIDGTSYWGYARNDDSPASSVELAAPALPLVLPRLCATGRFGWRDQDGTLRPLGHDDGAPWTAAIHIARAGEALEVSAALERAGDSTAGDLLCAGDGFVACRDAVAPAAPGAIAWLRELGRGLSVPARDEASFFAQLGAVPAHAAPPLTMSADCGWSVVRAEPAPIARFARPTEQSGYFDADIVFRYGAADCPADRGGWAAVDADARRLYVRDRAAEAAATSRLIEAGARSVGDGVRVATSRFAEVARQLLDAGWGVEAEGRRVRSGGSLSIKVVSGIDWFDVTGAAGFDGVDVALPELLRAMRRGERFIALGDGATGMIPEEWVRSVGALARLGRADGDALRFSPAQTGLVDALLAARAEVNGDAAFERLRNRLSDFDGVRPAREPRGFRGELRPYQREGLGWFRFLEDFGFGGCLADDMGLGKTVQVLALLERRRTGRPRKGDIRAPAIIVVPKSLVGNWIREAERFAPRLRVLDYTGGGRTSLRAEIANSHLVVTTYGVLRRDIAHLESLEWSYAILDEAQAIKNPRSQAAKACRLLRARHRLALTGTPIENRLDDLGSIFEFLNPGMLGPAGLSSLARGAGDGDGTALDALSRAMRPFILRRTKEQVLDELPPKTEQVIYCDLPREQRRLYRELADHYRAALSKRIETSGLKRSKIHVLEALLRLRQAACHPALVDGDRIGAPSAKLDALVDQVTEVAGAGHKALVFSQFTTFLRIVRDRLDAAGIAYEYLDGRTRRRQDKVDRFQNDPDVKVFLISLKAGGTGLNLTAGEYVFLLDPWWNPAVEAQAIDRAHRIGQDRRVFAYRLIARDTVEEKVLALQDDKRALAEGILTHDKSLVAELTANDLDLLLS